jgi:hypothetical protein
MGLATRRKYCGALDSEDVLMLAVVSQGSEMS